jgi:hypothetical protein
MDEYMRMDIPVLTYFILRITTDNMPVIIFNHTCPCTEHCHRYFHTHFQIQQLFVPFGIALRRNSLAIVFVCEASSRDNPIPRPRLSRCINEAP